jgi:hypothetical protein
MPTQRTVIVPSLHSETSMTNTGASLFLGNFGWLNYIHNETYAFKLPPTSLAQAQALLDWHEHGVFTSKKGDSVGNSE